MAKFGKRRPRICVLNCADVRRIFKDWHIAHSTKRNDKESRSCYVNGSNKTARPVQLD